MAVPSTQSAAARKTAAAQQATLAGLVDIAVRQAKAGLEEMARRMVSALLDLTVASPDPRVVMRRVKSGNLLKENSYAFLHLASEAIAAALNKEVALLTPAGGASPASPQELSLVPLEQIDQQMALGSVSRPFDLQFSEQLATLGVRLGLLLGRDLVRAAHNPFRPDVYLTALHAAWTEFEPDPEAHALIAPLLRPELMFELGPLYDALIAELKSARKGKDDDTRFSKTDDRASRKAERARRDAALSQHLRHLFDGGADPALAIPDIPNLPQGSGGWKPSAAAGFGISAPELEGADPGVAGVAGGSAGQQDGQAPGQATGTAQAMAAVPAGGFIGAGAHAGHAMNAMPLLDLLGRLGAGAAAGAGVVAGAHPAMGTPGVASLPAFPDLASLGVPGQRTTFDASTPHGAYYLPRLRQSLPQGALSRSDETTLDLLSRVFESVLLDDAVAPETRELISFLQVPVLKTALRDRNFFFEEQHPARRLLDLLSQAGWAQRADADDPVYSAMRRSIERIHGQEEPEFAAAVADLEAGLAARDRAEAAAIAGPIAQATRQERQAAAARSAQRAVALRLAGEQVAGSVSSFLERRWTAALALAYTIEDSRPGAIDNATRTMEDLIWSVKPKATQEQRKALIARLPLLLGSLNKWLDATRWQDAERLQFFAELADCHASIVRAPIELSPERQLELAVEAAQQDALRRVAQEQAQADEEEAEASAPASDLLAGLERGVRLEISDRDGVRKVRLAWVSPLRTLYIFSGAGRQEAFSLSAARLVELLQAGTIRVVAAEGVVGRILGEAVGADADAAGVPVHG